MQHLPSPAVFAVFVTGLCLADGPVQADTKTVLTVTTDLSGGRSASFDRDDLEKLRQVTYRTSTIWTSGVLEFQGVPLSEVLKAAGMTGTKLVLRASNDYAAEMPMTAVTEDVPIVAMTVDGKPMALRDKGPLWVVFPYDISMIYQTEVVYTRSVWQLEQIDVLP